MEALQKIAPKQWKAATNFMKAIPDAVGSMETGNEVIALFADSLEIFLSEPLLKFFDEVMNEENMETISNFAETISALLIPAIKLATEVIKDWGPAINDVSEFVRDFTVWITNTKALWEDLLKQLTGIWSNFWETWTDFWGGIWDDFWEEFADDFWDGVTKLF